MNKKVMIGGKEVGKLQLRLEQLDLDFEINKLEDDYQIIYEEFYDKSFERYMRKLSCVARNELEFYVDYDLHDYTDEEVIQTLKEFNL